MGTDVKSETHGYSLEKDADVNRRRRNEGRGHLGTRLSGPFLCGQHAPPSARLTLGRVEELSALAIGQPTGEAGLRDREQFASVE
jgi:hypothetical protein